MGQLQDFKLNPALQSGFINSKSMYASRVCRAAAGNKVAFLGLGRMGQKMAQQIAGGAFDVTGFDVSEASRRSASSTLSVFLPPVPHA